MYGSEYDYDHVSNFKARIANWKNERENGEKKGRRKVKKAKKKQKEKGEKRNEETEREIENYLPIIEFESWKNDKN